MWRNQSAGTHLWPEKGIQEAMLSQYGGGKYAVLKPYCVTWPAP
jgi:hypothetical protein